MPARPKTSGGQLIEIGIALATEGGVDAVTIAAVAKVAGIKGPSIYKHFADRGALLTAIEISVLQECEVRLRAAAGKTPKQRLIAMAHVYRNYVHAAPLLYSVLYRTNIVNLQALVAVYRATIQPVFDQFEAAGVPQQRLLPLARTLVAFLHGFVSMEIAQAFHLGGGLDAAFAAGIQTILKEI